METTAPEAFSPHKIVQIKMAAHLECRLSLGDYSEGAIALTSNDEIATKFAFCQRGFSDRADTQRPSRCIAI